MTYTIVGGGFTGMASLARLSNEDAHLYESTSVLGGVHQDLIVNGHIFFSGCQYLDSPAIWQKYIDLNKLPCTKFTHTYGSYTDIFGLPTFSHEFGGPVYSSSELDFQLPISVPGLSLFERIKSYPPPISQGLNTWFESIGINTAVTHSSVAASFQASRVYCSQYSSELFQLKSINPVIDNMFGLPRHWVGLKPLISYLPISGYNNFFSHLSSIVGDTRTTLNTPVRPQITDSLLQLNPSSSGHVPKCVIWTANPLPLIREFNSKLRFTSRPFYAEIIVGFLSEQVTKPFYVQVFSSATSLLRIFVYNINGRGCFTLEKAKSQECNSSIVKHAQHIFQEFMPVVFDSILYRKAEKRHYCFSVHDYQIINSFQSSDIANNLVLPNLLAYGRCPKIESIYSSLDSLCPNVDAHF